MARNPLPSLPNRAYQRPDIGGFAYQGRPYRGFRDRTALPLEIREQVAKWAVAGGKASRGQLELLAAKAASPSYAGNEPGRPELLERLHTEEELLNDPRFTRALNLLGARQRRHILRPQLVLQRTFVWPLRTRDAARVLGDISENQLRDWDAAGVCTPVRWGRGQYRGYFRSQLLMARLVGKLLAQGYGLDRIREDLGLVQKPPDTQAVMDLSRATADSRVLVAS